ncbi:hypothetical protein [Spirosoma flavum]|uniref:DUF4145 domain-containing protein n=1 Tax=Spirosoma flavum TaxID=2048557 RepID=A0ABW6ARA2_9BACT
MRLLVSSAFAIKILEDRLKDLNAFDFDSKVWKDRTILELKQIFGITGDQWLQVNQIHFDTYITSEKQSKLTQGKATARKLIASYIDFIKQHSAAQQEKVKVEEESYQQKYVQLLSEWNEFVPKYNTLLGEHENLQQEAISLYDKISELETQIKDDELTDQFFPFELVEGTRGYIENVAKQSILSYQNGLYDSCLVMVRKLIETLIIEAFEVHKIESNIKSNDGFYFYLSDLISILLSEAAWTITRNSQQSFPKIKKFADLSAHNRRFNAKKNDIDQIKDDIRIVIEELVHLAKFDKKE